MGEVLFDEYFFSIAKNITLKYPQIFENIRLYQQHKKPFKAEYKQRINVTIDPSVYEKYRLFCHENGFKVSSKIEKFMMEELKNNELKKELK